MPVEELKPKKVKPPRITDDFMIADEDGNVYQGLDAKGAPRYGHPSYGEIFRHKSTASALASQAKISGGRKVSVVTMSYIKGMYSSKHY